MLREIEAYRGSWGQFKLFFSVERKKSFISICNNAMRERNDRERRRNKKQCEQGSKKEKEGCNIWTGRDHRNPNPTRSLEHAPCL